MIITRTPFRVSYLGGGTDIPWFFENYGGGAVISAAIDKYMFLSAHPMFASDKILLKYSTTELAESARDLNHPIAREILTDEGLSGIDISVSADIPAGTGLGSSSAFTVGLTHLARAYKGNYISKMDLASQACHIELDLLKEPIGKQDQFASAFGGLNLYEFLPSGEVLVKPLQLDTESLTWLRNCMVLVRTGVTSRSASEILRKQGEESKSTEDIANSLQGLRTLALDAFSELQADVRAIGPMVASSWELKKRSSPFVSNSGIDQLIDFGISNGAMGSKLLGAGQGGFVLFIVEPDKKKDFISLFKENTAISVDIDYAGSTVVYYQ